MPPRKLKTKRVTRTFAAAEKAEHRRERESIEQEFPPGKAQAPPDDPSQLPTLGDYFDLRWLAAELRKAREAQGLSLNDIQERTQIDRAALSRIETGQNLNPTIGTLARYARALGKRIELELGEANNRQLKQATFEGGIQKKEASVTKATRGRRRER